MSKLNLRNSVESKTSYLYRFISAVLYLPFFWKNSQLLCILILFCFSYRILHNNSFYGIIPREIGDLQDLKMLDLGYNNFSGPIPSELQNILSLEFLWVRSSPNKCFSQINFHYLTLISFWRCRFLKGNSLSGCSPGGVQQLTRICEPENQVPIPTTRIATINIRRLLVSKRKDFEMINITDPIRSPNDMGFPWNSPAAPSPSEPIPPPPPSPAPPSQENKNKSSATIYASIGAVIVFLVAASSALCFFYYCRKKTSTVVPLSANSSSRQLQTTTMEGCLMC